MADDWVKLEANYKKLEPQIKKSTLAQANKLWGLLQTRDKMLETHEKTLAKAAIAAFDKGVKGKTVTEFMKDKGFGEAKKLLDTDRRLLVNELYELKLFCEGCFDLAKLMDNLSSQMAKAMKASKDKSPARTKVEKLSEALVNQLKDTNEAAAMRFRPDKYLTSFNGQYDKLIVHLLEQALKTGAENKEDDELPQPLTDKKLKEAVQQCKDLHEAVEENANDALGLKSQGSKATAGPMKKAATALSDLKKLALRYDGLRSKFKKEIAASKEKSEIEAKASDMATEFAAAEKSFKKVMVDLKK